jgi:hypothetical protein
MAKYIVEVEIPDTENAPDNVVFVQTTFGNLHEAKVIDFTPGSSLDAPQMNTTLTMSLGEYIAHGINKVGVPFDVIDLMSNKEKKS